MYYLKKVQNHNLFQSTEKLFAIKSVTKMFLTPSNKL